MIKIGSRLGVFKALVDSESPLSVEELAKPTGADLALVGRLLRYFAGHRLVTEVGKDRYAASQHTRALADAGIASTLEFFHKISNPAFHVLPEFLEENGYQSPSNGISAFHKSAKTDLNFFVWAKKDPAVLKLLQRVISVHKEGDWLSAIPFAEAIASTPRDRKVFVDINGNIGLQSRRLVSVYPELAGRIVLEDRPESVNATPPIEGVEKLGHDAFTTQPVKSLSPPNSSLPRSSGVSLPLYHSESHTIRY